MKRVYPVILTKGKEDILVYVPDFEINTQGKDLEEAIEMARDAIGLMGVDMEDDHEALPEPSELEALKATAPDGIITLVDVDFGEYRRHQNGAEHHEE